MAKQRRVNTAFWDDPYIETLTKDEKYLFLFFLTNPHTNIAGIYEISVKKIAFYTGLTESNITKTINKFIKDDKILYIESYIFILNHIKHQMLSEKIVTGIKNIVESLPFDVSDCFSITKHRVSYSIDRLRCIYKDIDININSNISNIKEEKKEDINIIIPTLIEWQKYFYDYASKYFSFPISKDKCKAISENSWHWWFDDDGKEWIKAKRVDWKKTIESKVRRENTKLQDWSVESNSVNADHIWTTYVDYYNQDKSERGELDPLIKKAFKLAGVTMASIRNMQSDTVLKFARPKVEKIYRNLVKESE